MTGTGTTDWAEHGIGYCVVMMSKDRKVDNGGTTRLAIAAGLCHGAWVTLRNVHHLSPARIPPA